VQSSIKSTGKKKVAVIRTKERNDDEALPAKKLPKIANNNGKSIFWFEILFLSRIHH